MKICNCDQIDKIIDVLHNEMQFYDEEGLCANRKVLPDIERALKNNIEGDKDSDMSLLDEIKEVAECDIYIELNAKLYWLEPPKNTHEKILRDQVQNKLNVGIALLREQMLSKIREGHF